VATIAKAKDGYEIDLAEAGRVSQRLLLTAAAGRRVTLALHRL
jgi:hypothetical protein